MTKTTRARYTLEFKQEAVRLVEGGQSEASVAKTPRVRSEVRLPPVSSPDVADHGAVPCVERERQRLSRARGPTGQVVQHLLCKTLQDGSARMTGFRV